jgi:hypothetical protein
MKDTRVASVALAPWHVWLVGSLMLVWNAASCYSYVMTLAQDEGYFRATRVTPEMAAYFATLPGWYVASWTVGVWGGVLAAVGLLLRKSWAAWWFAASQLAMGINSLATVLRPGARDVFGALGSIWAIVTIILGACLVLYSMAMKRRGVLR